MWSTWWLVDHVVDPLLQLTALAVLIRTTNRLTKSLATLTQNVQNLSGDDQS